MDARDAQVVLRQLQAAFPQYPNAHGLPDDTAELYLRMLTETNTRGEHLRQYADAQEAVRHWILSGDRDRFPLVGELLERIQAEARKRAAASPSGIPPAWEGLDPQELPPGPPPAPGTLDEATRVSNIERARQELARAVKRAPRSEYIEQERKAKASRPLEHCRLGDHRLCGDGPAGARAKIDK